ncbi:hypothetical protein DB30_06325 [Enhygromyxa salina]|uniref:Tetratricopeptide repeat protein n=1 Tax=Enhygromyxa salina TaxID=215803 RepID=A0A0C1ZAS9_9BACT|nr:hypothetical protein DB30_06325 [Enhygromyxa salina]
MSAGLLAMLIGCAPQTGARDELREPKSEPEPEPEAFVEDPAPTSDVRPSGAPTTTSTGSALEDADPARTGHAKQLFDEARRSFEQGDVPTALSLYEQAYAEVPLPDLKFNVAFCLDLLGRVEEACAAYRVVHEQGDDSLRDAAAQALSLRGC